MPENENDKSNAPKPFVFVIMPFKTDFDDVYHSGIKDVVAACGGFAERVDEQDFDGSILDRIQNQIAKADLVIADVSGANPNVLYELGYAHALGKRTLLLTQNINDIPFDLKHRPHIDYGSSGGKIATLKDRLTPKLKWAIQTPSATRGSVAAMNLRVSAGDLPVALIPFESRGASDVSVDQIPIVERTGNLSALNFTIENLGTTVSGEMPFVYFLLQAHSERSRNWIPPFFYTNTNYKEYPETGRQVRINQTVCNECRMPTVIEAMPPHTCVRVGIMIESALNPFPGDLICSLRLGLPWGIIDYPFVLRTLQ